MRVTLSLTLNLSSYNGPKLRYRPFSEYKTCPLVCLLTIKRKEQTLSKFASLFRLVRIAKCVPI